MSKDNVVSLPLGNFPAVRIAQLRHAFSDVSRDSDLVCSDPSMAQQHAKDDADINVLLERFKVTGIMPTGLTVPSFGDFTGVTDYQTAANAMLKAEQVFMEMPAAVRSTFENNPQKFLEFCADKENLPQLRKWGFAVPEAVKPEPMEVRVVQDPPKA